MYSARFLKLKNSVFNLKIYFSAISSSLNNNGSKPASIDKFYSFSNEFPGEFRKTFYNHFVIYPDFISDSEEENLMNEIDPLMKRMRYQFDHWDNAIQGFRETERSHWRKPNSQVLDKVKTIAFADSTCLPHAHILDLDEKGHIKPHIDSVRFCGNIIAGLCLLSDAIMRLQKYDGFYCDVYLRRRSLYIMSGPVRYDFTHEVLADNKSLFNGSEIIRKRRISVILRSEPEE